MAKVFLYNPTDGAPVTNWYDGQEHWSLAVEEAKQFPPHVAKMLKGVFGFLVEITEEDAENMLAQVEEQEKNPSLVKVSGTEIVPKTEEEVAADVQKAKKKKTFLKKLVEKVKKGEKAEPSEPEYEEMSRGALLTQAMKRGLDLKGLGKSKISKEQIISLLKNDDNNK